VLCVVQKKECYPRLPLYLFEIQEDGQMNQSIHQSFGQLTSTVRVPCIVISSAIRGCFHSIVTLPATVAVLQMLFTILETRVLFRITAFFC
jgi:hypothetical protein